MNSIAYFSMEIGLHSEMPTYCGGLGILAGDTLRAAADLAVPMLGMTLLHRQGYFRQSLDADGNQSEEPCDWRPEDFLERIPLQAQISIEGRKVSLTCWRLWLTGISGHKLPVYFLDTCLPENAAFDQSLTGQLYGGDNHYRLCQEAVLGLGGIAMLRLLEDSNIHSYHMNEGHAALLILALLEEKIREKKGAALTQEDREEIRRRCVFTTHTPVPAGHDQFPLPLAEQVLGKKSLALLTEVVRENLNLTHLALHFSRYINGVALRHGEISRGMFPEYPINSITNGVHAGTWVSPAFQRLFDENIPEWRRDNLYLRHAITLPLPAIEAAHREMKRALFAEVEKRSGIRLDPALLTLGFARRATAYKRADLLFSDLERLKAMARRHGGLQILYAGKAHPHDTGGKDLIRKIHKAKKALQGAVEIAYLENYEIQLAHLLCAGVDVWLNTPQKPHEASGTSGMKAALNGVPSLSVLDGWWVEGHLEGITGWSIGESAEPEKNSVLESEALYEKLERKILPLFYATPEEFTRLRRSTIAFNGSFFNTQRMVLQYVRNAYSLDR